MGQDSGVPGVVVANFRKAVAISGTSFVLEKCYPSDLLNAEANC